MNQARLLLIDQSNALGTLCTGWHTEDGYTPYFATPAEAVHACQVHRPDAAILDLRQTRSVGLQLIQDCLKVSPGTRFILIGRSNTAEIAVAALRAGAHDYLPVPIEAAKLRHTICAALGQRPDSDTRSPILEFIGISPSMQTVYDQIRSVARSREPVFLRGESGTGKELCAAAIHRLSDRADGAFLTYRCNGNTAAPGGLDPSFGEALLRANGGTLFLDNICDLGPDKQGQLLRVLDSGLIETGQITHAVDLRVICASIRDIPGTQGPENLRSDLYYRLNVLSITMPPLRDRDGDLKLLSDHLLRQLNIEENRRFSGFAADAWDAMCAYDWPGNVHQLKNVLRQVMLMQRGPIIHRDMLPVEIAASGDTGSDAADQEAVSLGDLVGRRMLDIERSVIEATIVAMGGSVPRAADVLGLSPSTIYRKRESWR